jgi:hypothetical protein
MPKINIGDVFYHYKYFFSLDPHFTYKVTGIAGNASSDKYSEQWVVYEPIYKSDHLEEHQITCYIRPMIEFLEFVDIDGNKMPRFTRANKTINT